MKKTDLRCLESVALEIVSCCHRDLKYGSSENRGVIQIILNEFQTILDSIRTNGTIPVLNGERQLWSTRTIVDSANFAWNEELFDKVRDFSKLCKRIDKKYVTVKNDIKS